MLESEQTANCWFSNYCQYSSFGCVQSAVKHIPYFSSQSGKAVMSPPGSLVSIEDMLRLEFSLILKDDMEAKLCCFQGRMPAERVSSLAANQVCGPCFIQGHFLL